MIRTTSFGLLNSNTIADKLVTGAAGGALWSLGSGIASPLITGNEINPLSLAQNMAANSVGGAVSSVGLHYGGNLLRKVHPNTPAFSMHYMNANFNIF